MTNQYSCVWQTCWAPCTVVCICELASCTLQSLTMHQGSLLKLCALYVEIKLENYVCSCSCAICKFDEVCLHLYTIHACDKFLAHSYIKKYIFISVLSCLLSPLQAQGVWGEPGWETSQFISSVETTQQG